MTSPKLLKLSLATLCAIGATSVPTLALAHDGSGRADARCLGAVTKIRRVEPAETQEARTVYNELTYFYMGRISARSNYDALLRYEVTYAKNLSGNEAVAIFGKCTTKLVTAANTATEYLKK